MNEKVIEYIKANATSCETAISSIELCKVFEIEGGQIRRIINKARCEGLPICACGNGYYYTTNNEDIVNTINSLRHRASSIEKSVNGLLKNII